MPDVTDHIGAFAVTAGPEEVAIADRYAAAGDDISSILVKSLADRFAEALAEHMHAVVRRTLWGYSPDEPFSPAQIDQRTISRHPPCAWLSMLSPTTPRRPRSSNSSTPRHGSGSD